MTITELKWAYLTGAINEMKRPNQFLRRLLYGGTEDPVPTEDIEMSVLVKGRETAPFVRKNGEAIMVAGHSETFQTVSATNIRIKRPFTPSELLYTRRPGTAIFVGGPGDSQATAIQRHINRDLQLMADYITNAEEWLVAQTLQGVISYEVADQEVFQITFPRSVSSSITLSIFWDNADPTLPRPLADLHAVKRVMSDNVGLQPTDCILGQEAADALLELAESGNLDAFKTDSGVRSGTITFLTQFDADGAIFLGEMGGIRFWEYSRTVTHNGSSVSLIRPKYAEFIVANSAAAERVMYYGAIPDMRAMADGRLGQMQRFAKSWEQQDPSVMMALAASRPLPVPRRPDASVSVKVVSG
jgi:hypothetical protein